MARASRRNVPKRSVRVDFTGVGEGFFTPPEGDYAVEISKIEKTQSSSDNDQLQFDFKVLDGKHKGKVFRGWFSLVEQALWKLAGILRSAGIELPDEAIDLDFDDIEGRQLLLTIEHREWNGETRADIRDSSTLEEAPEEEEEKPARGRRSTKEDNEEKPAREGRRSAKEEEPARGRRSKKNEPEKFSSDQIQDMSEEELEDVIEKNDLKVDLDEFKTLRRKAAAVIDALEAEDLLED